MRFVLLRRRIFPLVKGGINIILGEVDIEKTNLSKIGGVEFFEFKWEY